MSESGGSARADLLERALDAATDGVAVLDADGRYRYVNQSHATLYGFDDPDQLVGDRWTRLYEPDQIERFEEEILPRLERSGSWRGTAVGRRTDGETFPQELSLTRLSEGEMVCVVRDVTRRVERKETLEHYETVLEQIRDGVYTLDTEGTITWVNQTAVEEFEVGYSRDELVGSPVSKVLSDEDIEECLSIIRRLARSEDVSSGRCEVALQTAYGTEIPCELHLTLLRNGGDVEGTVGVVRDITERKRREQRLSVLNRVLRHNLRNELNVVMGQAEVLARNLEGEYAAAAETIEETAERLTSLGEKARTVEAALQRDASHRTAVDLVAVVERCCETARDHYPEATVEVDTPERQPVLADRTVETVVDNLVENALEHGGDSPNVRVSVGAAGEDSAVLRVEDDGPGIPAEELERLGSEAESQMTHGTGLGLWMAYWVVDSYGGDLSVECTDGGTTVAVRLRTPTTET